MTQKEIIEFEENNTGVIRLYLEGTFYKTLGNAMTRKVSGTALDVVLSYPINENEFLQWRDSQEVEQASRALLSPYTKVIEKSPVYKTSYDIFR